MYRTLSVLMAASIAFAAVLSTASAEETKKGQTQSRSDLGQKLQLQLQEANNIYTRTTKAQSDMSAKWSQTLDGIAQNMK